MLRWLDDRAGDVLNFLGGIAERVRDVWDAIENIRVLVSFVAVLASVCCVGNMLAQLITALLRGVSAITVP